MARAMLEFMFHRALRPSLPLIALYLVLSVFWVGFAYGVAPNIITAAYHERSLPVLNWVFQGHRSVPAEHYLDRWSSIAVALQIAMILHLVIVLFTVSVDRKHRLLVLNAPRADLCANFVLIAFSAAFLASTALSRVWALGDYANYLVEWMMVREGNPWYGGFNSYGPLFNVLAPLAWVNPFANKLLFAFSYLVCVIWLIKRFAPGLGLAALSWPGVRLWLLNPFPWVNIVFFGYFDVLVAIACVAAVHSLVCRRDGVSGTYLALGILLKYMPIVILPFFVFSERRFHFRLLSYCVGVVILGLVVSVLIWGTSTFLPLTFAATRSPQTSMSIYEVLASIELPLRLFWDSPNFDWLEKLFLLTAGLGVFAWCVHRRTGPALSAALAISVTLLFYRAGYIRYQMVLFCLILYWVASKWEQLEEHSVLVALLAGYFGLLAIIQLGLYWFDFTGGIYYSIVVFKFLLGCALLVGLVQFHQRELTANLGKQSGLSCPTQSNAVGG
jgi:hypothetical protein